MQERKTAIKVCFVPSLPLPLFRKPYQERKAFFAKSLTISVYVFRKFQIKWRLKHKKILYKIFKNIIKNDFNKKKKFKEGKDKTQDPKQTTFLHFFYLISQGIVKSGDVQGDAKDRTDSLRQMLEPSDLTKHEKRINATSDVNSRQHNWSSKPSFLSTVPAEHFYHFMFGFNIPKSYFVRNNNLQNKLTFFAETLGNPNIFLQHF